MLPSREVRLISKFFLAIFRYVGSVGVNQEILGGARSKCWLGKHPVVRAVVKNPIGHPYGAMKVEHQLVVFHMVE